jgi:hypothetical protein
VRKSEQAALMPARQRRLMAARRLWVRFNRDTGDRPNRYLYFPLMRIVNRARRLGGR